jgi:hypothetical protein
MFSTSQLHKSWILVVPNNIWVPPCGEPKLTEEQINDGYVYEWNENLYQENGAMGNLNGWVLIKKSV